MKKNNASQLSLKYNDHYFPNISDTYFLGARFVLLVNFAAKFTGFKNCSGNKNG